MATPLPVRTCQFHGGHTDNNGFLVFCGEPVQEGSSYCPEHHRRIYQRPPAIPAPRVPPVEIAGEEAAEVVPVPELERDAA